eukprot:982292_1
MTEFADLGAHCYYDLCKQQSFLPFDCDYCKKTFCQHHRNPKDHECNKIPKNNIKGKKLKKRKKFKCKVKGCKTKTLLLIKCAKCNGGFCTEHRHCDLHNCPKDVTENKDNDNNIDEEIADNRWVFVKNEMCKHWNAKVLIFLQNQIGEEEYDFDDVIEDFGEYSLESNESALMDVLIDEYEWEDQIAQNFHKDITNALLDAPQLDVEDEEDDDIDIYGYDDDNKNDKNGTQVNGHNILKTNKNMDEKNKSLNEEQKKNIIQWMYNELSKYIQQSQVMNITNKVIGLIMNNETDDQMQYQLWQLLG